MSLSSQRAAVGSASAAVSSRRKYARVVGLRVRAIRHGRLALRALSNRNGDRQATIRRYLLLALADRVQSDRAPTHEEKAAWLRAARGMTPAVAVDGNYGLYFVSPDDDAVGRTVFLSGGFDETEMEAAVQFLEQHTGRSLSGRCFIDIGANIGTTTILALNRYGASDVIAFEPAPDTHRLLSATVAANGLSDRVDARQVGLTDHAGIALMEASQWGDTRTPATLFNNWGDRRIRAHLATADSESASWPTTEVAVARLEDQGIDWSRVSLVWMDVQGHEGHVLAGAPDLAALGVPVLTEYTPHLLRASGGISLFHDAATRFATVVDVRTGRTMPGPAVQDLAEYYSGPSDYTDLLLVP